PAATGVPGYDTDEVGVCMARINSHLQDEDHVRLQDVRNVTFSGQTGAHGYDEAHVDAVLKAVIELLDVLDSDSPDVSLRPSRRSHHGGWDCPIHSVARNRPFGTGQTL